MTNSFVRESSNKLLLWIQSNKLTIIIILGFIAWIVYLSETPFFWDTIQLSSMQGQFFYDNWFNLILPNEMDSGHPPLFPYYLALGWLIFGKSLLVSHLLMIPWIVVFIIGLKKLSEVWIPAYANWAMLAVIVNPIILAQLSLISPDILLIACFTWALYALAVGNEKMKIVCLLILALISLRGLMVVFCFFIADIINKKPFNKLLIQAIWILILPGLYFLFHYLHTGWILVHSSSPWQESFNFVDFNGLLKNCIVFFWRLIDFGNIIILTLFLYLTIVKKATIKNKNIWILYRILFLVFGMTAIIATGLNAHRYLLPLYICLTMITISLFTSVYSAAKIKTIFITIYFVLLTGNFWIYPDRIAQGWDGSLAFIPYFDLHQEATNFMKRERINIKDVGSTFPNLREQKFTHLNSSNSKFTAYDLTSNSYILYSNIMNDFKDHELSELKNDWIEFQKWKSRSVIFILYKNPNQR